MVNPQISEQVVDEIVAKREGRLEKAGITRSRYLDKLNALLDATKPISCVRGKEADGGTVDFVDVPDNRVQLDAVKVVIALYGDAAPEKIDVNHSGSIMGAVAKVLSAQPVDNPVDKPAINHNGEKSPEKSE
jgi:hypothetical protein